MRYLASVGAGLFVALLLFLLMHFLISGGKGFQIGRTDSGVVDFIRLQQEELTQLKDRTLPKPPEVPKRPPPPPQLQVTDTNKPPRTALDVETPDIVTSLSAGGGPYLGQWSAGDPADEGDVIPIVRIEPQVPREALLNGINGWVDVEFTITEDGSVEEVSVIAAEPRRIFNRNAIRAILRWKFKPRVVDGRPVKRRASQRIEFKVNPD